MLINAKIISSNKRSAHSIENYINNVSSGIILKFMTNNFWFGQRIIFYNFLNRQIYIIPKPITF